MSLNETLTDDQIRVAVDWWAKAIQAPTYDNGDDSSTGALTQALAQMVSGGLLPVPVEDCHVAGGGRGQRQCRLLRPHRNAVARRRVHISRRGYGVKPCC